MDQLFNYIWSSKRTTTLSAALSQPRQGQHLNPIPGINNIGGNDCWVNSLMQLIATVPSLQNMIFDISRIYLSNTPTVEIKHAALTLKREIVKLTDDRSIKRSISQANSADFRRALQTLLPSLSANEQEDTIEALLGLTGLYELLIKREQEFTGREQGLFSIVTTRHYIPESETKPLEPKLISTLALNVLQRSSTQNLRQFLPGSDKTTPNGLSIEDRKVITRLFPNNPYSFPTLVDSCSSYQQFDRIIFLELVKFEPMLRYLYHSPSGVATEGLLDRKKQVFSNFLQEYFNQKADPSSERCFYYSEQLNAMQSHKLDKITRKIQDQPQEFLFFVQRFNEGMKLKHQF
ncbi:MAG: ubiquitin carboxyl-terminal hydrolase, partial [Chlamydiae bacterium]|nr:ubiquitin carboxyl-terminal hydrolase [Chlamydiota bacterium]